MHQSPPSAPAAAGSSSTAPRGIRVTRYRPVVVRLPANGPLARNFADPRQHGPGRPPLEPGDHLEYDRHSVFHDVFLSPAGDAIEAVGPPLVNLAEDLLPLRAELDDGTRLRHRMRRLDRAARHRFELPVSHRDRDAVDLRLRFAYRLDVRVTARRVRLEPVALQFATLQKDNPAEWVLDWLRYVAAQGAGRVLLYDNASADADALFARLADEAPLDVAFVDWPHPYGPTRSHRNRFCQATQNEHAHRRFGAARWTGHFDVDEYPVCRNAPDLVRMLAAQPPRTGLVRLDSHWMPDVRDPAGRAAPDGIEPLHRVRDFEFRLRQPRGKAHKYFARAGAVRLVSTHNARPRLGWFRRSPPPSDACFFHYAALTTDWRRDGARGAREPFDSTVHVRDTAVTERLEGGGAQRRGGEAPRCA